MMRNKDFGISYGMLIQDGPLAGILARSLILLNKQEIVQYEELVPEITHEPNYEAVLRILARS
jgi:thiol peroxidase